MDLTYSTGTVSVAANGTVVTGVSTFFLTNLREYDFLVINNLGIVPVFQITDETHINLKSPWQGGAQSGVPYVAYKISPNRFIGASSSAELDKVATYLNSKGVFYSANAPLTVPDPSIGNDGDWALKTDSGGWLLWQRQAGVWVAQGSPAGVNYRGNWNSTTNYVVNDRVSRLGTTYISKAPNINQPPEADTTFTFWDAAGVQGGIGPAPVIAGTSATLVTAGVGSQTFATQSGIAWAVGQRLRATSADGSLIMSGIIATYSGASLTLTVDYVSGSGSSNNWTITIAGERGLQGIQGNIGNTGSQGIQGIQGIQGTQGPIGNQGIQGPQGVGVSYNSSGTLAQRTAFDNQTQGYAYLETDVSPFQLWIKRSNTTADWAGPTFIGGSAAIGDLGQVTDSVLQTYDYGVAA